MGPVGTNGKMSPKGKWGVRNPGKEPTRSPAKAPIKSPTTQCKIWATNASKNPTGTITPDYTLDTIGCGIITIRDELNAKAGCLTNGPNCRDPKSKQSGHSDEGDEGFYPLLMVQLSLP